jgi:O-antigen/teichoic acid export membrane protein
MISPAATLTRRTAQAAQWRFVGSAVAALSQFAIGVWLARLLSPVDFGVVALTRVALGLVGSLGGLGIGEAVVQRADLTERHVRAAFTFSWLFGLAGAIALAAGANIAAELFRDPTVASVLRVMAIGFAVQGTALVAAALIRRHLEFRKQVFIDVGSYLAGYGVVAVGLALSGYGVWSLAWGSVVQTTVAAAAQLAVARPAIRPLLARRELGELLHFGLGSAGVAGVNYLALNGDNFVVGRWAGAESLGLYARAYTLMNLPYTYASSVVSSVLFPAFARVQSDPARLRRAYLTLTQLTATIAASAMGTMGISAPHLVVSLYGPQWTGVVLPLQILCLAGYFRALYHLGGIVSQSAGRVYGELWRQVIYAVLVMGGAFAGLRYGLGGVAAGVGLAILYMFVATNQLALAVTEASWREYLRIQRDAVILAVVTSAVALGVRVTLEGLGVPSGALAAAILAGAAIPWSLGMLWTLGDPNLEPLRAQLPAWSHRLIDPWRRGSSA